MGPGPRKPAIGGEADHLIGLAAYGPHGAGCSRTRRALHTDSPRAPSLTKCSWTEGAGGGGLRRGGGCWQGGLLGCWSRGLGGGRGEGRTEKVLRRKEESQGKATWEERKEGRR